MSVNRLLRKRRGKRKNASASKPRKKRGVKKNASDLKPKKRHATKRKKVSETDSDRGVQKFYETCLVEMLAWSFVER